MLEFFWEIFQTSKIYNNQATAEQAENNAAISAVASIEAHRQVETLALANQAMWELLSERLGITDAELVKKMNEIDLRDGKLDGKMTSMPVTATQCSDCGKTIGKHRTNCYWCGARVVGKSPFST